MSPGPSCALCAGGTPVDPSPHPGIRRALRSPEASASTQSLPPQHPCSCCGCHGNRASLSLSLSLPPSPGTFKEKCPCSAATTLWHTAVPGSSTLSFCLYAPQGCGAQVLVPQNEAGRTGVAGSAASFCCCQKVPPAEKKTNKQTNNNTKARAMRL